MSVIESEVLFNLPKNTAPRVAEMAKYVTRQVIGNADKCLVGTFGSAEAAAPVHIHALKKTGYLAVGNSSLSGYLTAVAGTEPAGHQAFLDAMDWVMGDDFFTVEGTYEALERNRR